MSSSPGVVGLLLRDAAEKITGLIFNSSMKIAEPWPQWQPMPET